MKILVTGSQGQLGKELLRQLHGKEGQFLSGGKAPDVQAVEFTDFDIANLEATRAFCRQAKPDIVFNCAAFTAVDACEEEVDTAFRANALGPRNLAIATEEVGAKLVHVSTDYVFDGKGILAKRQSYRDERVNYLSPSAILSKTLRPYRESDATAPSTVYGQSKLAGEVFVREFSRRWFILRTAWLYGDGKNFVKSMLGLSEGRDEVSVVADQHGTPTSTRSLAAAMIEVAGTDAYGTYHASCEGMTTWFGFAEEIYRLYGIQTRVIPITVDEYPRPAIRPHWSVMDNSMLRMNEFTPFPDWKEDLERTCTQEQRSGT